MAEDKNTAVSNATVTGQGRPDLNRDLKPGSSAADAARVGGKGEFGAHADDVVERSYASRTTRDARYQPAEPASRERNQGRTAGVQGNASGPGSSSGGDIDASVVNVGDSGLAEDIPVSGARDRRDERLPHADDTDGSSNEFASGKPAPRDNQTGIGQIGGGEWLKPGAVAITPDARTLADGADAVSHANDEVDDSFRGEISSSEASGRDDAGR